MPATRPMADGQGAAAHAWPRGEPGWARWRDMAALGLLALASGLLGACFVAGPALSQAWWGLAALLAGVSLAVLWRHTTHRQSAAASATPGFAPACAAPAGNLLDERLLRVFTSATPAAMAYFDRHERCLFANEAAAGFFQCRSRADAPGLSLRQAVGDDVYAACGPALARLAHGIRADLEVARAGDGRVHTLHLTADCEAAGVLAGFCLVAFDVTEARLGEQARHDSQRHLKAVTDNIPVLISYVDATERVTFANAVFKTWLGKDPEQVIGRQQIDVLGEKLYHARASYLRRALSGERVSFTSVVPDKGDAGGDMYAQATYVPDIDAGGKVAGIFVLVSDVTAMKRAELELDRLARIDALTQLGNRRQLEERLAESLARMNREGCRLAVMYLDIDHFKAINDGHGHPVGDAVLVEFSARLSASVRANDFVARLAGDEFVILLEGLEGRADGERVAEKIAAALQLPMHVAGQVLQVSCSIGIAFAAGEEDPALLLSHGDEALYSAKRAGRNTYAVYGRSEGMGSQDPAKVPGCDAAAM